MILALLFLCLPGRAAAVEHTPVFRFDAAGGQVFFKDFSGTSASFSGSAAATSDWLLGDGLRVSDRDTLIGTVSGQYLRRDQVDQLGGGNTLVSQTLDDGAALRWVHSLNESWAIKPNLEYKNELAVALPQERLGAGFFDNNMGGIGLELERKGETLKSLRQTLGVNRTVYYHYQVARSPLFGSELLADNGDLNFNAYSYGAAADYEAWSGGLLSGSAQASYLRYTSQRVVDADPAGAGAVVTSRKRHDWLGTFVLGLAQRWSIPRLPLEGSAGLTAGYSALSSDQNDFDFGQSGLGVARFNPDYYSYAEESLGPLVTATWARRLRATLSYNYTHRGYRARPTQDSLGIYMGGKIRTNTQSGSVQLAYQVWRGLSVQTSGGYVYARANTSFEKFVLYNYSYPFYFVGFGYAL